MAQAQKHIETKKEGEYEFRKFHVLYFDFPKDTYDKLQEIWDRQADDYEYAYSNGLTGDMDGCLWSLDCKKSLFDFLEKDYKNCDAEDVE